MKAVRQTIATVLSLPEKLVFDADGEQDISGIPSFITVGVVTSQPIGSEYKFIADDEKEVITQSRVTTVSINAYGQNAYLIIEKLSSSLRTSFAQQRLKSAGATVLSASAIRNLPTAIAGGKEQRAQMDLTISHIHRIETQMNRAETVDISLHEEKQ